MNLEEALAYVQPTTGLTNDDALAYLGAAPPTANLGAVSAAPAMNFGSYQTAPGMELPQQQLPAQAAAADPLAPFKQDPAAPQPQFKDSWLPGERKLEDVYGKQQRLTLDDLKQQVFTDNNTGDELTWNDLSPEERQWAVSRLGENELNKYLKEVKAPELEEKSTEHNEWLRRGAQGEWNAFDWDKYNRSLPYPITTTEQSDTSGDMVRRKKRLNELATGLPYIDQWSDKAAHERIRQEQAEMDELGIEDPEQYLAYKESQSGSQNLAARAGIAGVKGVGEGIRAATVGTANTAADIVDTAYNALGMDVIPNRSPEGGADVETLRRAEGERWREMVEGEKDKRSVLGQTGARVVRGSAQALGEVAPGAVTGGLAGSPAAYAYFGTTAFTRTYEASRVEGKSVKRAAADAAIQSAIELGTEVLGGKFADARGVVNPDIMFNRGSRQAVTKALQKGGFPKLAQEIVESMGTEALEEGAAEILGGAYGALADGKPMSTPEEVAEAMVIGALTASYGHVPSVTKFLADGSIKMAREKLGLNVYTDEELERLRQEAFARATTTINTGQARGVDLPAGQLDTGVEGTPYSVAEVAAMTPEERAYHGITETAGFGAQYTPDQIAAMTPEEREYHGLEAPDSPVDATEPQAAPAAVDTASTQQDAAQEPTDAITPQPTGAPDGQLPETQPPAQAPAAPAEGAVKPKRLGDKADPTAKIRQATSIPEVTAELEKLKQLPEGYGDAVAKLLRVTAEGLGLSEEKLLDGLKVEVASVETSRNEALKEQQAKGERPLAQETPTPRWYSKTRKLIEEKMGGRATGEQVLAMLRKNGAKEEELEWMGLTELLAPGSQVTKQQALDAIDKGGVQVEEVVKGGEDSVEAEYNSIRNQLGDMDLTPVDAGDGTLDYVIARGGKEFYRDRSSDGWVARDGTKLPNEAAALANRLDQLAFQAEFDGAPDDTRYEQYQLPGGENYRELLLTLPPGQEAPLPLVGRIEQIRGNGKWRYTTPGGIVDIFNTREEAEKEQWTVSQNSDRRSAAESRPNDFASGHFNEPNVLAHVRFNERTDADGKRVLFIEEIQSDWHQKGRKQGYGSKSQLHDEILAELNKEGKSNYTYLPNIEAWKDMGLAAEFIERLRPKYQQMMAVRGDGVPDAPFKTTWPMLAMKRAIQWAAENGFDRVAWTTGEQQAERYDLSKQVESIRVEHPEETESVYFVDIDLKEGGNQIYLEVEDGVVRGEGQFVGQRLEDVIGKEMAEKILAVPQGGVQKFSNDSLRIGGDGMKGFYDKILPAETQKFIKKFGAKVGRTNIASAGAAREPYVVVENRRYYVEGGINPRPGPFQTKEEADAALAEVIKSRDTPVHSFDITPAMRESALREGQPLFQKQKAGKTTKGEYIPLKDAQHLIRLFTETADASTFLHEYAHWMRRVLKTHAPEMHARLEKAYGVEPGGKWNVKQEEALARQFERYLRNGKAPAKELRDVFRKLAQWLRDIYVSLKSGPLKNKVNPELRKVFDEIYSLGAKRLGDKALKDEQLPDWVTEDVAFEPEPLPPEQKQQLSQWKRAWNRWIDKDTRDEVAGVPEQGQYEIYSAAQAEAADTNSYVQEVIADYKAMLGKDAGRWVGKARNLQDPDEAKNLDLLTERLRRSLDGEEPYSSLASYAQSQGDSLEDGLWNILKGGLAELEGKLLKPQDLIYDALNAYYERQKQDDRGDSAREPGDESPGSSAEDAPEAGDFALQRESTKGFKRAEFTGGGNNQQKGFLSKEGLPGQRDLIDTEGLAFSRRAVLPPAEQEPTEGTLAADRESARNWLKDKFQGTAPTKVKGKTKAGNKLISELQKDIGQAHKARVGQRSIVQFLVDAVRAELFVMNSQTTRRSPAHYQGKIDKKGHPTGKGVHIIRGRSWFSQYQFHEAGHAMSALLADRAPLWTKALSPKLMSLVNMPYSMASANNLEEAWAEGVRRYVVAPHTLARDLTANIRRALKKHAPELLDALDDAQAAYALHRTRPTGEQLASYTNDKPRRERTSVPGTIDAIYRHVLMPMLGANVAIHRLNRRVFSAIGGDNWLTQIDPTGLSSQLRKMINRSYRAQQQLARKVEQLIQGSAANIEASYQSTLHIPVEAARALYGSRRGDEGIRVYMTGTVEAMLGEEVIDLLEEAGFTVPRGVTHGEWWNLTDKSFDKILQSLPANEQEPFLHWAQWKSALFRYKKFGHHYPGINDGFPPKALEQYVNDTLAANRKWLERYKEMSNYFDQLMLVNVLSGEKSPAEAIRMKQQYDENYFPLPREMPDGRLFAGGGGVEPSAGVRRARGSADKTFKDAKQAVEAKVKKTLQAYYSSRLIKSVREYGSLIDSIQEAPFDIRKEAVRLVIPLKMDIKPKVKLTEDEIRQKAAQAVNNMLADQMGISLEELKESGWAVKDDEVNITGIGDLIFRSEKPNIANIVRIFEKGVAKYYHVPDPFMLEMFAATGKKPQAWAAGITRPFREIQAPWKRLITQNLAFAATNLVMRDSFTAVALADRKIGKKSFISGFLAATAVLNRLTGDKLQVRQQSELLSRSIDEATRKPHEGFMGYLREMLAEGILIPGWNEMTWSQVAYHAPGQIMSTVLKPIDIFNFITGGRHLAQQSESLTREGALIRAKKHGLTQEEAQLMYDTITGNFSQRGANPSLAEFIRAAGFLNPSLQILWGITRQVTHPDPAARLQFLALRMPLIATTMAVATAVDIALMYAFYDEDDREEMFNAIRERQKEEKHRSMVIMGKAKFNFDNGIVGAVQSYSVNTVLDHLLGDPMTTEEKTRAFLARATELPGITDTLPPHIKLWVELGQTGPTGHSFFLNDDIVPAWMVDKYKLNPEMRTYEDTPALYKHIGEWTGSSPLKVRYAVKNGLSRELDKMIELVGKDDSTLGDYLKLPVRRLIKEDPTGFYAGSTAEVADMKVAYDAIQEKIDSEGDAEKKAALQAQAQQLETAYFGGVLIDRLWEVAKDYREVGDDANYDLAKRVMVGVGRDVLGAEPLKSYPDPWDNYDKMPAAVQKDLSNYAQSQVQLGLRGLRRPIVPRSDRNLTYEQSLDEWRKRRDRALDWLVDHKNKPVVGQEIRKAMVGFEIPTRPKMPTLKAAQDKGLTQAELFRRQMAGWQEEMQFIGKASRALAGR